MPLTKDISNIFFSRSTDGGQTFSEPNNLSENSADSVKSCEPQISSHGNKIYVVWQDETDSTSGNFDIFFSLVMMEVRHSVLHQII